MKVDILAQEPKGSSKNKISFEGYKVSKSEYGFREFEFSYPFDPDTDNCYVEIYKLAQDPYGNYYTTEKAKTKDGNDKIQISSDKATKIDLAKTYGIGDNQAFAYHYLLLNKAGQGFPRVRVDAGDIIDERSEQNQKRNLFNIVTPNKSYLSRGGAMKLVIVDSQHVGYVYNNLNKVILDKKLQKRGQEGIKTLFNKFGGTLAGLEHGLDNGEYDGYGRIISLPLFTDDDFSAHAYWNKNCMQMASSLGNINNYASFQRKMFAHGINFVSDGAFVNEGLEGVHFNHMLRWGEDSPYYYWFRASSLKDSPLSLGVFSKNSKYISHKVVNSPYTYVASYSGNISIKKNRLYDKSKPTYIQFFDTRLVTEEERNDTKSLIKTYSKMSTPNVYDLHTHNDSIFPYSFEINPETYNKNVKRLNKYNNSTYKSPIRYDSYEAARLLSKNENFVVDGKYESGFETWDANPDIAKLNFIYSNTDSLTLKNLSEHDRNIEREKILKGNYQVQDYVVTSGMYWTQKTDDILRLYAAQNLKRVDKSNPDNVYQQIISKADNKIFPKSVRYEVTKAEVENVLSDLYKDKRILSNEDKKSQILRGLMDFPLDSCEFGDNIVSVLASPLISKRASREDEIGKSRYDIYKLGNPNLSSEYAKTYTQMDNIYTNEMYNFALKTLDNVNDKLPDDKKLFKGDEVTEFGKYVLPILTQEIAKYAIIKSLAPNNSIMIDQKSGEIAYDYESLKQTFLQTIGIYNPASVNDEAEMLLYRLRKGMANLDSSKEGEIVESLSKMIKDTDLYSFKLADLIIDKTQSGLDWRIDATKDIADVEALRNTNASFDYTWQGITDFWKKFATGVYSKNPNAYIVAEVTNQDELHDKGYGGYSKKYPNVFSDVIQKFLRETGITSIAEYSLFFRGVSNMFGSDYESGSKINDNKYLERVLFEKMLTFIRAGSLDSIRYAYTFIGNHDKPRALHCSAMDMELFYADLNDNRRDLRERAYKVINDKYFGKITDDELNNFDFSRVSSKAVAMAEAIRPSMVNVLNKYKNKFSSEEEFNKKAFIPISRAVADLAQGKFNGKRFDPDAFGMKPIDVAISMTIKQAKSQYGFELPADIEKTYEDEVFEAVMTPAYTKLLGMMKFLVALPGMPTLFDGDDAGTTGYDTKSKNMFVQCRQRNHDEWLERDNDKYKAFIAKYNKEIYDVMKVRRNPKCNALNNGAVYTLPLNTCQTGENIPSVLRQSTDGRMTISIFNPTGLHNNPAINYCQNNVYLDRLYFDEAGDSTIGVPGLRQGLKFVNAADEKDIYYTRIGNDGRYYLARHYEGKDVPIPVHDTTVILYHVPEGDVPLSFTGKCLLRPSTKFIVNAYTQKTQPKKENLLSIK